MPDQLEFFRKDQGRGKEQAIALDKLALPLWDEPNVIEGLEPPKRRKRRFIAGFEERIGLRSVREEALAGIKKDILRIVKEFNLSPIGAEVLSRRFFNEEEGRVNLDKVASFLNPSLTPLESASLVKGMREGVKIFTQAIKEGKEIIICADYDVDGVTSAAQVVLFLRAFGFKRYKVLIPHRLRDGYGLNERFIKEAVKRNALLIALDIGTNKVAELNAVPGLQAIVIDHHIVTKEEQGKTVLINPSQKGCGWQGATLCAAGLTYVFLNQCAKALNVSLPKKVLAYSALGTIADVVPLQGLNRAIAKEGLKILEGNCGVLSDCLRTTGALKKGFLSSEDISYFLAPALNAAGRLSTAKVGFDFLVEEDGDEGLKLFRSLLALNEKRKEIERRMLMRAIREIEREVRRDRRKVSGLLFVHSKNHRGINGIVASRLSDYYHCPVIVLTQKDNAILEGSARSGGAVDFRSVIERAKDFVIKIGGHSEAGGVKLKVEEFNRFKGEFLQVCRDCCLSIDYDLLCDLPLTFEQYYKAYNEIVNDLRRFEPFGNGNEKPLFFAENVGVEKSSLLSLSHWEGVLRQGGSSVLGVFWHRVGHPALKRGKISLAYSPMYTGREEEDILSVEIAGAFRQK